MANLGFIGSEHSTRMAGVFRLCLASDSFFGDLTNVPRLPSCCFFSVTVAGFWGKVHGQKQQLAIQVALWSSFEQTLKRAITLPIIGPSTAGVAIGLGFGQLKKAVLRARDRYLAEVSMTLEQLLDSPVVVFFQSLLRSVFGVLSGWKQSGNRTWQSRRFCFQADSRSQPREFRFEFMTLAGLLLGHPKQPGSPRAAFFFHIFSHDGQGNCLF